MTISQLAERSGVAASALRYYEELGLIFADRSESGHRRYPRTALRRIAFIVFAQRVGFTLDEVGAELQKLPRDSVPVEDDWDRIGGEWTRRIDGCLDELQFLRKTLTTCIACGCLSLETCKIVNPEDRASRIGPGPLLWKRFAERRERAG